MSRNLGDLVFPQQDIVPPTKVVEKTRMASEVQVYKPDAT